VRHRPSLPPRRQPLHRINQFIRVDKVRVIGAKGEQLGVMSVRDALIQAAEAKLDLVEVAPNADPPVCKIEDYGKLLYERKKRERAAKKKQKNVELKEVKVRPNVGAHDLEIKMNQSLHFLEAGNKVKISMVFRGREIATANERSDVLKKRVLEVLGETADIESFQRTSARQTTMILAPKPGKVKPKPAKPENERAHDDHDDDDDDDDIESDEMDDQEDDDGEDDADDAPPQDEEK